MATNTTSELSAYYPSLLILQYVGKTKAYNTVKAFTTPYLMPQTSVQTLSFSPSPTAGSFVLSYGTLSTSSISWAATAIDVQSALNALTVLASVTVTGSVASGLTVTMTDVPPVATVLTVASSTLVNSATPVVITIAETDLTIPLAVQNAYNLIGTDLAQGVQLDVIGKYVGVSRYGTGFSGQITLDDSDFLSLIRMAILKNYSGSSLSDIQTLIHQFFSGLILIFDYKNMQMSFLISSLVGSTDLIQLFVTEGLLPVPMAVSYSIIYAPIINTFFGFRTYAAAAYNASPFNSYQSYQTNRPWLSYANAVVT